MLFLSLHIFSNLAVLASAGVPIAAMIGAAKAFLFNLAQLTQLFHIFLIWSLDLKWFLKCIRSIDLPLKEIRSSHFWLDFIWLWGFLNDDLLNLLV